MKADFNKNIEEDVSFYICFKRIVFEWLVVADVWNSSNIIILFKIQRNKIYLLFYFQFSRKETSFRKNIGKWPFWIPVLTLLISKYEHELKKHYLQNYNKNNFNIFLLKLFCKKWKKNQVSWWKYWKQLWNVNDFRISVSNYKHKSHIETHLLMFSSLIIFIIRSNEFQKEWINCYSV